MARRSNGVGFYSKKMRRYRMTSPARFSSIVVPMLLSGRFPYRCSQALAWEPGLRSSSFALPAEMAHGDPLLFRTFTGFGMAVITSNSTPASYKSRLPAGHPCRPAPNLKIVKSFIHGNNIVGLDHLGGRWFSLRLRPRRGRMGSGLFFRFVFFPGLPVGL